ncbi:MAG: hypothetical protein J5815_01610 [Clostridia bacterium]|nr:hypothetical protein [Clostridia bacterium]
MRPKIDRKFYPFIWLGLIVASLVSGVYPMYVTFSNAEGISSAIALLVEIFKVIFAYGAIPTAVCFFFALILYSLGARRGLGAIPRNDFIYSIMIFTAIVRFLVGVIEMFCILEPKMYIVTSTVLNPILQPLAYGIMFFFVFAKNYKLNPAEKYYSFRLWAMVYLILLGIAVLAENLLYIIAVQDAASLNLINELVAEYGYILVKNDLQTVASAIALAVYGAYVVAAIVLGEIMRGKARRFQDPATRGEYFDSYDGRPYTMRDDVGQTYADFDGQDDANNGNDDNKNSGDGNVFDEFDM